MLSLDAGKRSLVLLQRNVPGFVDSSWEALDFRRSSWGVGLGNLKGVERKDGKKIYVWNVK